ncbi:MAG: hypothetical protein SFU86_17540 [Pirellulaceae bacterium]|nr:hypothetical protein [Pirellulaceae bacterium]
MIRTSPPAAARLLGLAALLAAGGCIVPIRVTQVEFDGLSVATPGPIGPAVVPPVEVLVARSASEIDLPEETTSPPPVAKAIPATGPKPATVAAAPPLVTPAPSPLPNSPPPSLPPLPVPVAPAAPVAPATPPALPAPAPAAPAAVATPAPTVVRIPVEVARPKHLPTQPPHWHFPPLARLVRHQAEPVAVAAESAPPAIPPVPLHPVRPAEVAPPPIQELAVAAPAAPAPQAATQIAALPAPPPARLPPLALQVRTPPPVPLVRAVPVSTQPEPLPPAGPPEIIGQRAAYQVKTLREISIDITPPKLVNDDGQRMAAPPDYAAERFAEIPVRDGDDRFEREYDFVPSPAGLEFCYQPLYFEELNVERYGRNFGLLQPVVSTAHFYSRIPLLPYMAIARPARQCTYHNHWTLPGYRVPWWEKQPPIVDANAAAFEICVAYGVILLLP